MNIKHIYPIGLEQYILGVSFYFTCGCLPQCIAQSQMGTENNARVTSLPRRGFEVGAWKSLISNISLMILMPDHLESSCFSPLLIMAMFRLYPLLYSCSLTRILEENKEKGEQENKVNYLNYNQNRFSTFVFSILWLSVPQGIHLEQTLASR